MTKEKNKNLSVEKSIETTYKIIVIEDDDGLSFLIRKRLKREGFQIDWAENGKEALSKITGERTEILLVDYKLPDMTGKELIEKLTENYHKPPHFISMTGFGDEKIAVELMKLGAHDYIVKEADFINVLIEKLRRTCVIIDKQKKLEEIELALKESELNYHALYETMAEGVVYQNGKGEIISANPAAERILGLSYSQMIGVTSMDPGWRAVDENKKELPGEKHPAMVALSTGNPVENFLQGIYNPEKKDYVWIIVNSIPQFKEGSSRPFQVYSTFLDVTLRINAEESLRKQRELLLETGKMAIVGGWELSLENNKLVFSDMTKEIHEVPLDFTPTLAEAINFYPPETRPTIENAVQKAIKKGISYNLEVPFITAKGSNIWVNAIGKPDMKDGKCVRLHGTFQDITERKNKEEELKSLNQQLVANEQQLTAANQQLKANEQQLLATNQQLKASEDHLIELNSQLSLAQNIAKIGYWTYDIETQIPKWTDECFKMFNIPKEEGEPDYPSQKKYIHPDDWDLYDGAVQKLISKNIPYDIQIRLVHNNGNIVWMRTKGFPGKTIDGKLTKLYGIVQDITEFKNSEKQLIEQKMLFETMFNSIQDAIVITDANRQILLANKGIKTTFDYEPEDLIGKQTKILYADYEKFLETGEKVFSETSPIKDNLYVTYYKDKKNNVFPGETFGTKLYNANGKWIGNLGIIRDVTERLNYIEDIKKAKEKAEEADRLKSAFLANMSHEIRTPMNGILGFTNLLLEPNLTGQKQQKYIEIIQKSGDRMLNTVNDIIDISKIETGQMELSLKEFNISKVLEYQFQFFYSEAEKKGIKFTLSNLLPDKSQLIYSDEQKFNSILTNLIKNALKFTDKGFIEVICSKNDEHIACFVKDSGIGIPVKRQKAIFDRFVQADIADTGAFEGSGLGLAISKAYAEMLGGKLWVESVEGIGSTFYLNIPIRNSELEKLDDSKIESIKELAPLKNVPKILIAEDDEVSFLHLSILLKDVASEIIHAKTGIEAVDFCRKYPDINLVLMDIKMPQLNGYEATRRIREFNKEVVIIAQTAFALSGDGNKSIEVGCNDYITKPIDKDSLLNKMATLLT